MAKNTYRKHFIPLESNPELFTELIHKLGVSSSFCFQDVLSLEDPELLSFIPRPAYALILVFPTSDTYGNLKAEQEAKTEAYLRSGDEEDVMFYRQTINNACGLYGILHAVCNGPARTHIVPASVLANIIEKDRSLNPDERANSLENNEELELAYASVATRGATEAPDNPEDEVEFHYICLVKSHINNHLYQLDGDRKAPIDLGAVNEHDDALSEPFLKTVRQFVEREKGENLNFNLMALVGES